MRPLVILKTGDTLPGIGEARGDFDAWITPDLGWSTGDVLVVEVHRGEPLPEPASVSGTIVTGSPAMVTDRADWSERSGAWLADLAERGTPVLGICYGHQLLADALGGEVGQNPRGREIGTVAVHLQDHDDDPLLGGLPVSIEAHTTHLESVIRLPDGAKRLGANDADGNHAFRVGDVAWGIQFHPEFDADIMRRYIHARRQLLLDEGIDADAVRDAVRETPVGPRLLARFGEIVLEREAARGEGGRPPTAAR